MNGNPQSEQLSAYYDNQLPLDERALVERELAESPEMRHELNDYSKLSSLLKSLPPSKAPAELQSSVLRMIERESLLPVADTARPRRLGRLLIPVGAACALAAIGFFAMKNQGSNNVAQVQPSQPLVNVKQEGGVARANVKQPKASEQLQIDHDQLKDAQVGDVVNAVSRNGAAVSVIRLTVVGRDHGIDELRVLLAGESGSGTASDGKGLTAVYLQTDPKTLSANLEKVLAKFDIESMSVSQPVAIEKLDDADRQLITDARGKVTTLTVKPDSELDRAVKSDAVTVPTATGTTDSNNPARVIFVLLNAKADSKVM